MKLELKHIAPYLPYDLKIVTKYGVNIPENGKVYNVSGVCEKPDCIFNNCDKSLFFEVSERPNREMHNAYYNFKPILRPLTDLTKEIEHNGEKFVPINELLKLSSDGEKWYNSHRESKYSEIDCKAEGYYAKSWFKYHATIGIKIHTGFLWNIPTWITNELHRWHFDTLDLTQKDLAINVNTL